MRALIVFAFVASGVAFGATPQPMPEKMRAEVDKIDLKINLINHSLKKNLEAAAELGNQIVGLREAVAAAKNPDNRARFEKALSKHEQRASELKDTIDAQFVQIRDLKTKRALIVAPDLAKYPTKPETLAKDNSALNKIPESYFKPYKGNLSSEGSAPPVDDTPDEFPGIDIVRPKHY